MSALTLTLKHRPDQRVDMSPLVCDKLNGLTPTDISAIKLFCGKAKLRVDELFSVSGHNTQHLIIENSFEKLDYIGKELSSGLIEIAGDAGAYCGLGLKGGELKVSGSVGVFGGCEMKKGYIEINGNAGDFLGGALVGNKLGMKGGLILVKGNAGDRAGDQLRRGTILIEGNAGDYCGSRMIAGTIAILGQTGAFLGYGMRRGTLLLWQKPQLIATFNDCGSHSLAFLPILFHSFKTLNSRFADPSIRFNRVQRYAGDLSETGRGEVLVKI